MATYTCFVLIQASIGVTFSLKRPNGLDSFGTGRDGRTMNKLPMIALLMILNFLLHCLDE